MQKYFHKKSFIQPKDTKSLMKNTSISSSILKQPQVATVFKNARILQPILPKACPRKTIFYQPKAVNLSQKHNHHFRQYRGVFRLKTFVFYNRHRKNSILQNDFYTILRCKYVYKNTPKLLTRPRCFPTSFSIKNARILHTNTQKILSP